MGSSEQGSPKRRATFSKVTAISSEGNWKLCVLGAPPVQERADQLVVEAKARPALRRWQSGPHEVPLNQAR
jgi:hypothetical protein